MKIKVTLTIGSVVHELIPDCLRNWGDVVCTYKRQDYSGVVRSFTSKFEFCGEAADLLLAAYLENEFATDVKVAVWAMGDDWRYTKRFECPLDFSTVQTESGVFSVSAVDNSIAALIKAEKGTKYEMALDGDILSDGTFHFGRIPMYESATFAFTDGESEEDSGAITVTIDNSHNAVWIGNIGSEIVVGRAVEYADDQDPSADYPYILRTYKPVDFRIKAEIVIDVTSGTGTPQDLSIKVIRDGSGGTFTVENSVPLCTIGEKRATNVGEYDNAGALKAAYPETATPDNTAIIATVRGIVFDYAFDGRVYRWRNTEAAYNESDYVRKTYSVDTTLHVIDGRRVVIEAPWTYGTQASSRIISSKIEFTWTASGEPCDIRAYRPKTLLDALLRKMCAGRFNAVGVVSGYDYRIGSTVLMAAEDVRGIEGAKLYTSFNEYCDWIEAVYGYTYYLGRSWASPFTAATRQALGGFCHETRTYTLTNAPTDPSEDEIYYNTADGRFMLRRNGLYWQTWPGSDDYTDPSTGRPYADRLYLIGTGYYYFLAANDGTVSTTPTLYQYDPADKDNEWQEVVFVPRTSLFGATTPTKIITDARDVSYKVDSSSIYSTVEIGYEKKDYDNVNGRDEFNFDVTYSTGCTVSEKKLTLKSKYRADSYGIEFAAQKRSKDSTDTDTDNDVFFAIVTTGDSSRDFLPRRQMAIEGNRVNAVFNREVSPLACVEANAALISSQASVLTLRYASSTANSDVKLGGKSLSSDITIASRVFTCGTLEFSTSDLTLPDNLDCLVQITHDGVRYTGFISEVEEAYARETPIKYKLLVKTIEIC